MIGTELTTMESEGPKLPSVEVGMYVTNEATSSIFEKLLMATKILFVTRNLKVHLKKEAYWL